MYQTKPNFVLKNFAKDYPSPAAKGGGLSVELITLKSQIYFQKLSINVYFLKYNTIEII